MQKQPFPVGGESKKFECWGELKIFRTWGLLIWGGGYFCWAGQYLITCHWFHTEEPSNLICKEKPLGNNCKSICWFYVFPYAKNQHHSSIQAWHIEDLLLGITLGMPRFTWPNSYESTEWYRCIYVCLSTWKKPNS